MYYLFCSDYYCHPIVKPGIWYNCWNRNPIGRSDCLHTYVQPYSNQPYGYNTLKTSLMSHCDALHDQRTQLLASNANVTASRVHTVQSLSTTGNPLSFVLRTFLLLHSLLTSSAVNKQARRRLHLLQHLPVGDGVDLASWLRAVDGLKG
jgi:hypothetical protein